MNSNFWLQTTETLSEQFSKEIWFDLFEENVHRLSEIKTLEIFLGIIEYLDRSLSDEVKILIKVHPAEDIRYYDYLCKKFSKVSLVGKHPFLYVIIYWAVCFQFLQDVLQP